MGEFLSGHRLVAWLDIKEIMPTIEIEYIKNIKK